MQPCFRIIMPCNINHIFLWYDPGIFTEKVNQHLLSKPWLQVCVHEGKKLKLKSVVSYNLFCFKYLCSYSYLNCNPLHPNSNFLSCNNKNLHYLCILHFTITPKSPPRLKMEAGVTKIEKQCIAGRRITI
jgi:hypothetical protein